MPSGIQSQGTKLYYSDGGSPSSFSAIGNITNFTGPGGSTSIIDISNLDSTKREKLPGLPDEGNFQFDVNLDPDNAAHIALRQARTARTRLEFKVVLTDTSPTNLVFFGYVINFSVSGAVNAAVKAAISLEIDGDVSWA